MEKKDVGEDILGQGFPYSKVCFLSNFPPKECGIATFTKDLVTSLDKQFNPRMKSRVIALNETTDFYNYGSKVIMQLNKGDIEDYIRIAKRINNNKNIRLVCVQHEFGLFGGEYGNYLVPFLEAVEKPVVITFHSVLPQPDKVRKKIVKFICSKAAAVIVMANVAVDILSQEYEVNKKKIHVVPHGIPNAPLSNGIYFKRKLRLEKHVVLSTFGLLSRGKGVEYMIKALPSLVKKYPNILYLVIGETHPVIRKREGEKYRNELIQLAEKLGLKNHVKFYNRYLTLQEIVQYLLASDIYVCTNLERNQIVSGTLSYAMGCGKAIVSTPSIYAEEVLNDERGLLARFKNPKSFSNAVDKILSDKELRDRIEKNAYFFGRTMAWSNVASRYLGIFNKVTKLREETVDKFPAVKLDHLKNLTDSFGCLQFSKLSVPDKKSGYTVDDNSRALIAAVLYKSLFTSKSASVLAKTYINFLEHAQSNNGHFINNFRNGNEISDPCSEDALGRAMWSLGYAVSKSDDPEIIEKAKRLFNVSYRMLGKLISLRSKAFAIEGLYYYNKVYKSKSNEDVLKELADSLIEKYKGSSSEDWQWFEDQLSYSNSKIPEALLLAYEVTQDKKYLEVAEKTLNFLSNLVLIDGKLVPIGHNGWCNREGRRAFFDQQPLDAACMVQTYLIAYRVTKNKDYYKKAILAFNWFLGRNYLKQRVYDEVTGGCYDGLSKNSLNLNRGAESTISYLIARLMLEEVKRENPKGRTKHI